MIKNKYGDAVVELGDRYEFCKGNRVYYGEVIKINNKSHSFDFAKLDNGRSKKRTGEIVTDVTAIRGIMFILNWKKQK